MVSFSKLEENDKVGSNMINQKMIDEVTQRLVKTHSPVAIYLFGSYAWGSPNEDSDLDVAVIVDSYAKEKH